MAVTLPTIVDERALTPRSGELERKVSHQTMKTAYKTATVVLVLSFAVFHTCVSVAQDTSQPSNADLAQRISDLEKQLADLKSALAAQKAAPAPAPAAQAVVSTPPAPAAPATTLASLLGPTTLSGFVDVYYDYNSNQPASRTTAYRNFDVNSSQIALNMLELVADKSVDTTNRVGYHIALGFGQAMNIVNSASPTETGFDQYLKEGYLEYMAPVGKGLQINVGKFVTPAGAEVIESKDNWNYTRSLLFAWAIPYFHFGLSAKYAFNSKFALTGYLVNGWNDSVDNNSGKTTGFSAAYTPNAKFGFTENYLVGPEQANDNSDFRHLSDTVITYNPNAKLSLMANYDYGHDHGLSPTSLVFPTPVWWSGIAGYIKYSPNAIWTVATRGEYFKDHNGFSTGTPQDLSEFTITLQRMIASKIISRLEFRRDMSNEPTFPYRDGLFKDAQNTVTLGLIYAFSSADAK
jgi:Putative beta-barrel porin-2, OmpL-like. bbp2